jgi:Invasion associated locus B (IalB) protein
MMKLFLIFTSVSMFCKAIQKPKPQAQNKNNQQQMQIAKGKIFKTIGKWSTAVSVKGDGKVKYVFSYPKESPNKNPIMVAYYGPNRSPEISFGLDGNPNDKKEKKLTKNDSVVIYMQSGNTNLYIESGNPWVQDDKALIEKMKKEKRLVLKITNNKGRESSLTYSLDGFPEVYNILLSH